MLSGEMFTNCGSMVTFLGKLFFGGQIHHFYGPIITLGWPLYTLSNQNFFGLR